MDIPVVKLVVSHLTTSVVVVAAFWTFQAVLHFLWPARPWAIVIIDGVEQALLVGLFLLLVYNLGAALLKGRTRITGGPNAPSVFAFSI